METIHKVIYLHQGELELADSPAAIYTLLGSCVGVTFFHAKSRCGGMIHAMFPENHPGNEENPLLYVDTAIQALARRFFDKGIKPSELEVKLFGGGTVIEPHHPNIRNVGEKNVQSAVETIQALGLSIKTQDTGKNIGRKVYFISHLGDVYVKKLCTFDENVCR